MTPPAATAARPVRVLLDTSVVIALERISLEQLPDEPAVSALTVAELAAGCHRLARVETDAGIVELFHHR